MPSPNDVSAKQVVQTNKGAFGNITTNPTGSLHRKTRYFWRCLSSPAGLPSDHRARVARLVLSKPKGLTLRFIDLGKILPLKNGTLNSYISTLQKNQDSGYAHSNFNEEKKWLAGKK